MECIIKECTQVAEKRGLCPNCHEEARDYVEKNKTSWERLNQVGLAMHPVCMTPFFSALMEKLPNVANDKPTANDPRGLADLIAGYGENGCTLSELKLQTPNFSIRHRMEMLNALLANKIVTQTVSSKSGEAHFFATE